MNVENGRPVALVTGASRGIGAAVCRRLAETGWDVAVAHEPVEAMQRMAEDLAADLTTQGATARAYSADLRDAAAVAELVASIARDFGRLDALVSNAAVDRITDWREISIDEWDLTMDVNVRAAWLLARASLDLLAAGSNSSIVLVSSTMARSGQPGRLHYSVSKSALLGMARTLSREVGPEGIRVNAVMPGAIRTESETERFGTDVDEAVIAQQSIRRRGVAADVAHAIRFLVSPEASFITGQVLAIDGGAH
ncbi:MAG: SDR family oxidoreductase [Microbacterium sp.]|nr:SDR family oxidoreductase [Microbacterium sp.]